MSCVYMKQVLSSMCGEKLIGFRSALRKISIESFESEIYYKLIAAKILGWNANEQNLEEKTAEGMHFKSGFDSYRLIWIGFFVYIL